MSNPLDTALTELRADYRSVAGTPFAHFLCPILFRDEDVPLCRGHVVNQAFRNSTRAWTVQRADVDAFYGSNFEADFVVLRHRGQGFTPFDVLLDPDLSRDLHPRFLLRGKPVDHYPAQTDVPEEFTRLEVEDDAHTAQFGLKITPHEMHSAHQDLEVVYSRDVRLPALVSLIKSAHLSLFDMVGYHYALSTAGRFIGRDILGEFFLANRGRPKTEVLAAADPYFSNYIHLVRPMESPSPDRRGTVENGECLLCKASFGFWAIVVFVRTDTQLHAVLLPGFDSPDAVPLFLAFLNNERDSIEVVRAHYHRKKAGWEISRHTSAIHWPKTGILYP